MENRIDWSKHTRKVRPYSPVEVEDSRLGLVKASLRRLLVTELDAAEERAAEYVAMYVTGGFANNLGMWCKEPLKYPEIDGLAPKLTRTSLRTMAIIEAMQPPGGHTIDDLIYMNELGEEAYGYLDGMAHLIQNRALASDEGKAPGEASETPSVG